MKKNLSKRVATLVFLSSIGVMASPAISMPVYAQENSVISTSIENSNVSKEKDGLYEVKAQVLKENSNSTSMAASFLEKVNYEIKDGKKFLILSFKNINLMQNISVTVDNKEIKPNVIKNKTDDTKGKIKFEIASLDSKLMIHTDIYIMIMGNKKTAFRVVPDKNTVKLLEEYKKEIPNTPSEPKVSENTELEKENKSEVKEKDGLYEVRVKALKEKEDSPSMVGRYIEKANYEIKDGKKYLIISLNNIDWMKNISATVDGKEIGATVKDVVKKETSDGMGKEKGKIEFEINNLDSNIMLHTNVEPMGNARVSFRVVPEKNTVKLLEEYKKGNSSSESKKVTTLPKIIKTRYGEIYGRVEYEITFEKNDIFNNYVQAADPKNPHTKLAEVIVNGVRYEENYNFTSNQYHFGYIGGLELNDKSFTEDINTIILKVDGYNDMIIKIKKDGTLVSQEELTTSTIGKDNIQIYIGKDITSVSGEPINLMSDVLANVIGKEKIDLTDQIKVDAGNLDAKNPQKGTYEVTYSVTYNGQTKTAKRKVIITEANIPSDKLADGVYTIGFKSYRYDIPKNESMIGGFFDEKVKVDVKDGKIKLTMLNTHYAYSLLDFCIESNGECMKSKKEFKGKANKLGEYQMQTFEIPISDLTSEHIGYVLVSMMGGNKYDVGNYDKYEKVRLIFNKNCVKGWNGFNKVFTDKDGDNIVKEEEKTEEINVPIKVLKADKDEPSMSSTFMGKEAKYIKQNGKTYCEVQLLATDWIKNIKIEVEGKEVKHTTKETGTTDIMGMKHKGAIIRFEVPNINSEIMIHAYAVPMNTNTAFRVVNDKLDSETIKPEIHNPVKPTNKPEEKAETNKPITTSNKPSNKSDSNKNNINTNKDKNDKLVKINSVVYSKDTVNDKQDKKMRKDLPKTGSTFNFQLLGSIGAILSGLGIGLKKKHIEE